jgi:hypothetical protein
MVAFGHTAIGVIVGIAAYQALRQGDIALGLIATGFLGIISHYLMDLVPHGHFFRGEGKFEKLIIWIILFDLLLPILFLLSVAHFLSKNPIEILYILFGIGGAQLPDVVDSLMRLKFLPTQGILKLEKGFHQATHWHGTKEKTLLFSFYDIWQVSFFALAVLLLIFY